ncbi:MULTISPECIES: CopG family ribbon-helix-helix protein [Serratia]|jgi:RHH-type rel operon transcriptional repressor/antitoxin RelB|uniref:Ribbon-helix-helix protein, CopG family n=1 Tax=Serratia fonticola TaxID=47917 RepID=A0AAJ2DBZ4_SERFO|nr:MULTISPECIES: ribbon-helix-helix protein, CopG family [Serratia]ATM76132.1 ribbon-helix-helix protein, CopG family [Serratia fonticola]MBC3216757.1 ribbon-helix-helix protein, CopG family [Serratia fonticola]MBC3228867.1 ribbon-helix-helix protein, CopG family [Serratia fonticola]MBE0152216.1 ribbon-helix-helix protein, CopG family [Serratia fonticola]MDQ7212451.1 ribbon-helix-helix protein, CopG family [Serratia fonticola]
MSVMSVRLSDDLSEQLEALAEATGRTKSFLATQAIQDFLSREAWQVAEIQQAIVEADNGDFASDDEMAARFKKMGVTISNEN